MDFDILIKWALLDFGTVFSSLTIEFFECMFFIFLEWNNGFTSEDLYRLSYSIKIDVHMELSIYLNACARIYSISFYTLEYGMSVCDKCLVVVSMKPDCHNGS